VFLTFSGDISNAGTISGPNSIGILLENVTTFIGTIGNTGTISGADISFINAPNISIFNSGTITSAVVAIAFGGGVNTLTLGPGFSITGIVEGSGSDTL
jgi:hypothetical protein